MPSLSPRNQVIAVHLVPQLLHPDRDLPILFPIIDQLIDHIPHRPRQVRNHPHPLPRHSFRVPPRYPLPSLNALILIHPLSSFVSAIGLLAIGLLAIGYWLSGHRLSVFAICHLPSFLFVAARRRPHARVAFLS